MIRKVVYLSSAVRPFTDEELEALVEKAASNNRRDGISGVMLYRDGSVCQMIEGAPERVEALLERLRRDPRHHRITVLLDVEQSERSMPGWAMTLGERHLLNSDARIAFDELMMIWPQDADSERFLRIIRSFEATSRSQRDRLPSGLE